MGRNKRKQRDRKLVVTFDEDARKEYLTGFHKRKLERRKKALEDLKARAKQEKREAIAEQRKQFGAVDRVDHEEEEFSKHAISELTGVSRENTTVEVKTLEDQFSKKAFGHAKVTITTSKLSDDNLDQNEVSSNNTNTTAALTPKNMKVEVGKAERILQKLSALKDRKKNRRLKQRADTSRKRRKGKKTGAKERRRRK